MLVVQNLHWSGFYLDSGRNLGSELLSTARPPSEALAEQELVLVVWGLQAETCHPRGRL